MTNNFTPPQGKATYTIRKERRRNKHTHTLVFSIHSASQKYL
jgi:hypothetical protein